MSDLEEVPEVPEVPEAPAPPAPVDVVFPEDAGAALYRDNNTSPGHR